MRNGIGWFFVGLLWFLLWTGRLLIFHLPNSHFVEGSLEYMITAPIGFAFMYDWFAFRRKNLPDFLVQPKWNLSDFSFFLTGGAGVITLFYYELTGGCAELKTMGIVGIAIGLIHWVRRYYRMKEVER